MARQTIPAGHDDSRPPCRIHRRFRIAEHTVGRFDPSDFCIGAFVFGTSDTLRGVPAGSDVFPCTPSSGNCTFHIREAVPLSSELPTGNSTIRPAAGLFDGRRRHSRRPVRHCAGPFPCSSAGRRCPTAETMFLQRVGRGLRHRKSDAADRSAGRPQRRSLPLRRVFGRIVAEAVPRFGKNSLLCVR